MRILEAQRLSVFESFRDPQGKVVVGANHVWRLVNAGGACQLREFLSLDLARQWQQSGQLIQTFLLPLLINKETGLLLQAISLTYREGLPVSEAARLLSKTAQLKPQTFSLVALPHLLSRRAEEDSGLYQPKTLKSAEQARFVLQLGFKRLRKQLEALAPRHARGSHWAGYTDLNQKTLPEYMHAKQDFVTQTTSELKLQRVLDIGCNTGFFSLLAAQRSRCGGD